MSKKGMAVCLAGGFFLGGMISECSGKHLAAWFGISTAVFICVVVTISDAAEHFGRKK